VTHDKHKTHCTARSIHLPKFTFFAIRVTEIIPDQAENSKHTHGICCRVYNESFAAAFAIKNDAGLDLSQSCGEGVNNQSINQSIKTHLHSAIRREQTTGT